MWQNLPLWPSRASSFAGRVDAIYIFLIAITGFFAVMILLLIFIFALRYRRARNPVPTQIEGSYALEGAWSVLPFGAFLLMFVWSASSYRLLVRAWANAMLICVVCK